MTVIIMCGLVLFSCVIMLIRNQKVFKYKMKLLRQVSYAAKRDINLGHNWKWRYDYFESVGYNQMMKKFWKPLDSFYRDKSFVEL